MSRVLVLGASGFIGRYVVHAAQADPRVRDVIAAGRSHINLRSTSSTGLRRALLASAPDVVVNATGLLDGTRAELVTAHTLATAHLVDAVEGTGIRLVRMGSAGEYGAVTPGTSSQEADECAPQSAYGLSHLAATRLGEAAMRAGVAEVVTLRLFNPIGVGAGDGVLVRAAHQLAHGEPGARRRVTLGALDAWRDFVDVRDVARAVFAAAFVADPPPVVNIGRGEAVLVEALVRTLLARSTSRVDLVTSAAGPVRSAGVSWSRADIALAHDALGWAPRIPLTATTSAIWEDTCHRERHPAAPARAVGAR